jgi:DNA repair protein RadC
MKNKIIWHHPGGKLRRLGPNTLSEAELLAVVLGSGSRGKTVIQISQEILDKYGNLLDLMGISLKDLMKIKGLKAVKATQMAALFEIARRILKHRETK